LIWLIFPILYFLYILLRGAISNAYPYPFLDVGKLGYDQAIVNALGMLSCMKRGLDLLVVASDYALAAQKRRSGGALGSAADF
jgi:hypothetical protein